MTLPDIDLSGMLAFLHGLLDTPSPTGYTEAAIAYTEQALQDLPGLTLTRTRKGALVGRWQGNSDSDPRAITAHVDTLGAMVKEIKSSGRLKLARIGGFAWNTVEGEGCTVFARDEKQVRGALLLTRASSHVHSQEVNTLKREDETMEVRLDARTTSAADTRELGIEIGDFVAFDPRVEMADGFVRSRHLDDKACVATLIAAVKATAAAGFRPGRTTYLHISNYEEVGHGAASGIPPEVVELLTLDMAAIGEGQNSDEFNVTLCVKDSGGPYHHEFSQRLRRLAEGHAIPYRIDIYPFYGSDGEAFWRAGGDVAVALIGPGVDASHNYERTHTEALLATARWTLAFFLEV